MRERRRSSWIERTYSVRISRRSWASSYNPLRCSSPGWSSCALAFDWAPYIRRSTWNGTRNCLCCWPSRDCETADHRLSTRNAVGYVEALRPPNDGSPSFWLMSDNARPCDGMPLPVRPLSVRVCPIHPRILPLARSRNRTRGPGRRLLRSKKKIREIDLLYFAPVSLELVGRPIASAKRHEKLDASFKIEITIKFNLLWLLLGIFYR